MVNCLLINSKSTSEANIICLIQHFEADILWKVSLKILNSGMILKTFTHANLKWNSKWSKSLKIFLCFYLNLDKMFVRKGAVWSGPAQFALVWLVFKEFRTFTVCIRLKKKLVRRKPKAKNCKWAVIILSNFMNILIHLTGHWQHSPINENWCHHI